MFYLIAVVEIAFFKKHQLTAAIVLVTLFLLAASVLVVVLIHHGKPRMRSSEHVTEKLRVTSSTIKTISLECSQNYQVY